MNRTATLQVTRLATLGELAPVRDQWNSLARDVPFRSWEWLESWWRHYGDEKPSGDEPAPGDETASVRRSRELCVLPVATPDGALVGLAPWYVDRAASQGPALRFLGSGDVCSDYLAILCQPGWEEPVASALADWLVDPSTCPQNEERSTWQTIELGAVHANDKTMARLAEALFERNHILQRRRGPNCWRIHLPPRWEDYLAMLSRSHRKQIRKFERRLFDTGRARLSRVETEADLQRGLSLLMDLHRRRRESFGQPGCFSSARFTSFHCEVAFRLWRTGTLRLYWLELDGRPIAAEYQIAGQGVVHAYQSGIEPAALRCEPGRLITMATLKQAIAEGHRHFDFLRGDEPYKAHWRAQPRPTQDLRILRPTGSARLRNRLWIAGDNVKSWIKSGLKRSGVRTD